MPEKISKVIDILEKEYEVYKEIRATAKKKQEAVIDEDIEILEEVVRAEVDYVEKLEELEGKRRELVGDKDISSLQEEAGAEKEARLEELKNKLAQIVEEVQDLNHTNEKLVKDSLQLVELELKTLTGQSKKATYSKKGQMGGEEGDDNSTVINHKA